MSGWRDTEGRTANERRKLKRNKDVANFVDTAKHRPLSLLKSGLALLFVAVIVLALVLRYF